MKTATVRQIRNAFPSVLKIIHGGESVSITSRRKIVATLTPPAVRKARRRTHPWGDLNARLSELQQQPMMPITGAEMIADDRSRY